MFTQGILFTIILLLAARRLVCFQWQSSALALANSSNHPIVFCVSQRATKGVLLITSELFVFDVPPQLVNLEDDLVKLDQVKPVPLGHRWPALYTEGTFIYGTLHLAALFADASGEYLFLVGKSDSITVTWSRLDLNSEQVLSGSSSPFDVKEETDDQDTWLSLVTKSNSESTVLGLVDGTLSQATIPNHGLNFPAFSNLTKKYICFYGLIVSVVASQCDTQVPWNIITGFVTDEKYYLFDNTTTYIFANNSKLTTKLTKDFFEIGSFVQTTTVKHSEQVSGDIQYHIGTSEKSSKTKATPSKIVHGIVICIIVCVILLVILLSIHAYMHVKTTKKAQVGTEAGPESSKGNQRKTPTQLCLPNASSGKEMAVGDPSKLLPNSLNQILPLASLVTNVDDANKPKEGSHGNASPRKKKRVVSKRSSRKISRRQSKTSTTKMSNKKNIKPQGSRSRKPSKRSSNGKKASKATNTSKRASSVKQSK